MIFALNSTASRGSHWRAGREIGRETEVDFAELSLAQIDLILNDSRITISADPATVNEYVAARRNAASDADKPKGKK